MSDADQSSDLSWVLYTTPTGACVVSNEIADLIGDDKDTRIKLGCLMTRIESGETFARDTGKIAGRKNLYEARLTEGGNEYRLYYAPMPGGQRILLAVHFQRKGSQGAQQRAIRKASDRLADWLRRI